MKKTSPFIYDDVDNSKVFINYSKSSKMYGFQQCNWLQAGSSPSQVCLKFIYSPINCTQFLSNILSKVLRLNQCVNASMLKKILILKILENGQRRANSQIYNIKYVYFLVQNVSSAYVRNLYGRCIWSKGKTSNIYEQVTKGNLTSSKMQVLFFSPVTL